MIALISKILLINIFFSLSITAFFKKILNNKIDNVLLLIISLGLGPTLTGHLLFLLLWLIPKQSAYFYFIFIVIFFLATLACSGFNKILIFLTSFFSYLRHRRILSVFLFLTIITWITITILYPITGHDMFEYATYGKVLAKNKQAEYKKINYDADYTFVYIAKHGPVFPAIAAFDNIYNEIFHFTNDYYFRSISGYYWVLLNLLFYFLLEKYLKNKTFAFLGMITLDSIPGFSYSLIYYHVDSFRIFLFSASFYLFYLLVKKFDDKLFYIYAIIIGLSSNTHSLNFMYSCINYVVLFFINTTPWFKRLRLFIIGALIFFVSGAGHYFIDLVWGSGWILGDLVLR